MKNYMAEPRVERQKWKFMRDRATWDELEAGTLLVTRCTMSLHDAPMRVLDTEDGYKTLGGKRSPDILAGKPMMVLGTSGERDKPGFSWIKFLHDGQIWFWQPGFQGEYTYFFDEPDLSR